MSVPFATAAGFTIAAMVLGALATLLNVILAQREITSQQVSTYMLGGAVGGVCAAWGVGFHDADLASLPLVMLSGYLGADLLHALAFGSKPR